LLDLQALRKRAPIEDIGAVIDTADFTLVVRATLLASFQA
jgi:hypothetical protein